MTLNLRRSHIGATEFDGVQTYGNPSAFFGLAAVGFVDLLGFSASARNNWNDGEDSPLGRLLRIKDIAERSSETTIAVAEDKKPTAQGKKSIQVANPYCFR